MDVIHPLFHPLEIAKVGHQAACRQAVGQYCTVSRILSPVAEAWRYEVVTQNGLTITVLEPTLNKVFIAARWKYWTPHSSSSS